MELTEIHPGEAAFLRMVEWLHAAGLATSDINEGLPRFVAGASEAVPVAFAGVSGAGPDRLLRSVVVDPAQRGEGIGRAFISVVESFAATTGAERLWLLTDSSPRFFEAVGYARRDRADAPSEVQASGQFTGLCPASAVLMCKPLH